MLLIIENKDDPTDPIAEETDGGAELVYIPVIKAPAESDAAQLGMKCVVDRMSYDFRADGTESESTPQHAENLMPLFLKELGHTGKRPEYLSAPAEIALFGAEPEKERVKFFARG